MSRRLVLCLASILLLAGTPRDGAAERLVSSLSTHQVLISSNFTGTELVLFGSIERDAATIPRRGGYNIVVTVIGPPQSVATRRKDRVFGIWTNVESLTFRSAPSYLAAISNRPLNEIAPPGSRERTEIGLRNTLLARVEKDPGPRPQEDFVQALIRLRKERGLYREEPAAVTFLTPSLFRASITIPAEAQLGNYEVEVRLFADGARIASTTSALEIVKVGLEQFVTSAARHHPFLYGLGTTLMALLTGWFASVIFRRD